MFAFLLGQEMFRSMTKTYFRRADGVILLYDVTSERSFLNVRQWVQSIDVSKTYFKILNSSILFASAFK
jgi:Ras and EF-hand domain-containing protein